MKIKEKVMEGIGKKLIPTTLEEVELQISETIDLTLAEFQKEDLKLIQEVLDDWRKFGYNPDKDTGRYTFSIKLFNEIFRKWLKKEEELLKKIGGEE